MRAWRPNRSATGAGKAREESKWQKTMIPQVTIELQTKSGMTLKRVVPSYNPPPAAVTEDGVTYVRTGIDQRGEQFVYLEAFVLALTTADLLR